LLNGYSLSVKKEFDLVEWVEFICKERVLVVVVFDEKEEEDEEGQREDILYTE